MSRTLHVVPIIHEEADLGRLAGPVRDELLAKAGAEAVARKDAVVAAAWDAIELWADSLGDALSTHRVYQDGLPVSEHAERIVADLAQQGSRNHRLIESLVGRGATLVPTEDPALLVREYQVIKAAIDAGRTPEPSSALLAERDRFIAQRINSTLPTGGTGVLFIGMLHRVGPGLSPDIEVRTPIEYLTSGDQPTDRPAEAG
ncbi:MAG: hypothetical protein AAF297_03555 [Planctomycetota bacterium]